MTFLYLNSDKMGDGDPKLGKKLMKSFLSELSKSSVKIDVIGCVNSAINLTTKGSEVIESLQKIEAQGAKIATCGTCLEFHKRQDDLLIGGTGSMEQTIGVMTMADKIIRPN